MFSGDTGEVIHTNTAMKCEVGTLNRTVEIFSRKDNIAAKKKGGIMMHHATSLTIELKITTWNVLRQQHL